VELAKLKQIELREQQKEEQAALAQGQPPPSKRKYINS
jgi:hypothetical protein